MSDPYEKVKGERLTFKGGGLATRSKTIDKKKKKKSKAADKEKEIVDCKTDATPAEYNAAGDIYSIDAAKKMKYDELFPVEAKKFGYVPKTKGKSVEEALDDRVKKKADRYCK